MTRAPAASVGALAALLWLVAVAVVPASPSAAAAPACAGETNLFKGVCYTTSSGAHWLGTITAANGKRFICVDFGKDSRLGAYSARSIKGAANQFGSHVGDSELRALSYAYAAYTSGGTSGTKTTDAALSLIAREVFGDSSLYPRIAVADQVKDASFGVGASVLARAREIWHDAATHFGPAVVQVQGMPATLSVGDTFDLTVHVQSASASGSHPMSGYVVRDTVAGFTVNAGDAATTNAQGDVVVSLTYQGPGTGTFSAAAVGLPGEYANLAVPDDRAQQRGLIETAATVAAQASVTTGVTSAAPPEVHTVSSAATVTAGASITDTVRVSGAPASYATTVTATLFGPYAARPGAADCTPATRVGSVTLPVAGDGEYRTPPVATKAPGYYVWQESFPPDVDTGVAEIVTPCGVAEETTLAQATPALSTQASTPAAAVGETVSDTVTISGAVPGATLTGQYRLLGPVTPSSSGTCEGLDWSGAGVLAQGAFTITAGEDGLGTAITDAVRVSAAGCVTFVERGDATATSSAIDWTQPGLAAETVLVKHQPTLLTQIHRQTAERGAEVFDVVTVSGAGEAVIAGQWKLLGLPEPSQGGCDGLSPEQWAQAETVAQGTFESRGEATIRTGAVTVTGTRCVTYIEHGDATPTTSEIVWTTPGIPAETTLVHPQRPSAAVPYVAVPAGIAGGSVVTAPRAHGRGMPSGVAGLVGAGAGVVGLCGLAWAAARHRRGWHRG